MVNLITSLQPDLILVHNTHSGKWLWYKMTTLFKLLPFSIESSCDESEEDAKRKKNNLQ